MAEWVVRDAAFGQGEVIYRPSQLVFYFVINLKETAGQPAKEKYSIILFVNFVFNLPAIGGPFHSDIWIQSVDEEDDVFGMLQVDYYIMAIFF